MSRSVAFVRFWGFGSAYATYTRPMVPRFRSHARLNSDAIGELGMNGKAAVGVLVAVNGRAGPKGAGPRPSGSSAVRTWKGGGPNTTLKSVCQRTSTSPCGPVLISPKPPLSDPGTVNGVRGPTWSRSLTAAPAAITVWLILSSYVIQT